MILFGFLLIPFNLLSVILLLFEDMYIMAIYLHDHFILETETMKMMPRLYLHLVG